MVGRSTYLPRPMTKCFVKSSGLKSFRVPLESLVLGLSASSESIENAALQVGSSEQ